MFAISIFLAVAAISPAKKAAIQKHISTGLLDSKSARWKWPAQQADKDVYCLWINGKNRFGAYTGWKQYYVKFNGPKLEYAVDNLPNFFTREDRCVTAGYASTPPD
ncbi:hypothetical protein [Sphingomonas hankookensis]|uniref:Uncharacterized protein n=1 Tax=Sphingomonas hankookensis TaxID=563996 RepID=A0ABR5YEU1_9SPHN|nr:hypothetical protein [Sphingomonas hankookensis]KZE16227.1 hypothetical protein AVT10_12055 [Sphingomonas hankookensis]